MQVECRRFALPTPLVGEPSRSLSIVMPGLDPGIHAVAEPWIAGSSPAMTFPEGREPAVASRCDRHSSSRAPCGRSISIARSRGLGSSRAMQNFAVTTSPDSALSMTIRAIAGPSSDSSASRGKLARLRVPGALPAGFPDCPATNRPLASRIEPESAMTAPMISMFIICSFWRERQARFFRIMPVVVILLKTGTGRRSPLF
jgi:hypothetical protein